METCVNCACQFQGPYQNCDGDDTFSRDLNLLNVYGPLSSIYKLNYLSSFLGSSTFNNDSNIIWKLCENCLQTFNNLHQFYEEFNQLRSLESKLAVEIKKLDDCIQNYQQHQEEENERKEEKKKSKSLHPSPIVVLQRLENDPLAQKYLIQSNSVCTQGVKRTRRSRRRTIKKVKFNDVPFSKAKVDNKHNLKSKGQTREIEDETCDDMDTFNDGDDDPFFAPSPQSDEDKDREEDNEVEPEEEEEISDDDDDDEYTPETKKQKEENIKKLMEAQAKSTELENIEKYKIGKRIIPSDDPELKERKKIRSNGKFLYNYRKRKTKVPNPCWECELDFPTQQECYDHTMSEHYQPGEHVCPNCSRICNTIYGLTEHKEKNCLSLKPGEIVPFFPCKKCEEQGKNVSFALKETLQNHLRRMHNDGQILECQFPECDYKTTIPYNFQHHAKRHTAMDPIEEKTCEVCKKVFIHKEACKAHFKMMHTEEGFAKYNSDKKRQVERYKERTKDKPKLNDETFCSECMVDMLTHAALIIHKKSVHGERQGNFVCEECGKDFRKKSGLRTHKNNVHVAERRFCCHECGKSFKANPTLQEHIKITHDEQGRLEYNARVRLQNKRRKIRKQALAQSLSAGIPQFTGAKFLDSNSGNLNNTSTNDAVDTNLTEFNLLLQENFGA